MNRILNLIFLFFIYIQTANSQIHPAEGSSLHYRLIGFSFAPAAAAGEKAVGYTLEIAAGTYYTEDSFNRNITITKQDKNEKIIAEVPAFGRSYTWRTVYSGKKAVIGKSPLFHFTTSTCPNVDTTMFRFRVLKNTGEHNSAYVFLDDNKALYDMSGNPIWYMPDIGGISITPRDLKLSPEGTITFLFDPPYEINYNGDILWKGPGSGVVSGDNAEHYHHEFTRLQNGHYMVLGIDSMLWKHAIRVAGDTCPARALQGRQYAINNDTAFRKMPFGTLIEYDEKGHVVWSWKSSGYFDTSDLCNYMPPGRMRRIDVHANAFSFDEKNNAIYMSFKNISRIIKIKYPEGIVTAAYGEKYKPGGLATVNNLFCGQHACKHSAGGSLYLYNNNICDSNALPKIISLNEAGKDSLEKIWEYECIVEDLPQKDKKRYRFISGGNVEQLPDHSIFVCMSGMYSKIFIVNRDKQETWSALPERWDESEKRWEIMGQYRASITSRKELEHLIWNSQK
jgi:hypothetical protein